MSMPLLRIFLFLITGYILSACATIKLDPGAETVKILKTPPSSCLIIDTSYFDDPLIAATMNDGFSEYLIGNVKNEAFAIGADSAVMTKEGSRPLSNSKVRVQFFSCQPVTQLNDEALAYSCKNKQVVACVEMANRAQTAKDYAKMLDYFKKGCDLLDKPSCDWIDNFNNQKAKLKKLCIAKDRGSCFAAAKIADVEQDFSLMMTFLKQGCSYGHSESCFYETYSQQEKLRIQEENERIKNYETRRYQEYMANLQEQTLRQMEIISTMAILNQRASNCVSRKNFDGSLSTHCY